MNVGNLINILQTLPPTMEVVVSKNKNGDCFSPLEKIGTGKFVPWNEPPFNGHIGELVFVNESNKNCVYIVPEA